MADDHQEADEKITFSFKGAQDAARAWWKAAQRDELGIAPDAAPILSPTLCATISPRETRGGSKGVGGDRKSADARIAPTLGPVEVDRLSTARIKNWLAETCLARRRWCAPRRGPDKQATKPFDPQRRKRGAGAAIERKSHPDDPKGRAQPRIR